jgi:hypothetical protein
MTPRALRRDAKAKHFKMMSCTLSGQIKDEKREEI